MMNVLFGYTLEAWANCREHGVRQMYLQTNIPYFFRNILEETLHGVIQYEVSRIHHITEKCYTEHITAQHIVHS